MFFSSNTEEVVRTSVLSTRWRYLWTSIPQFPSLNIDCDGVLIPSMTHPRAKNLEDFVPWVLSDKNVHLDSFCLCCSSHFDMSTVWRWVNAAVARSVNRLDLMFCSRKDNMCPYFTITLPRFLLVSESLESLSVRDVILKISCPKLKTLIIHDHKKWDVSIGLVVLCPELVFFECVGLRVKDPFILKKADSLKIAVILPRCNFHKHVLWKILARTSHVESLSFDCNSRNECDPEGNFPKSLPNLKTLELTTTFEAYDMRLLIQILTCSPNLECIHLIIQEVCYGSEYQESHQVKIMRTLSPYLKKVEFLGFERDKWKLDIAQLLLEHGNGLEKMVFSWFNEVDYHEKSMVTLNEVSKFHKASSSVELVTLLKK